MCTRAFISISSKNSNYLLVFLANVDMYFYCYFELQDIGRIFMSILLFACGDFPSTIFIIIARPASEPLDKDRNSSCSCHHLVCW